MSSVRSVSIVPTGVDPFARLRSVTNPATGQTSSPALLTGPVVVTVPLGPPGPAGVGIPGPPGAPGQPGPPGLNGAAGAHVERSFSTPASTWDWEHELGYTPAVTVLTIDRRQIVGSIVLNTPTRTVVEFYTPATGILALA